MTTSILLLAAAWFYPQMDLEIYRVNKMWQETDTVGMRAAHPGEVAKLREHVEFRRRKDDGTYETKTIYPQFRQPACIHSDLSGWEAKTFDGVWRPCSKYPDSKTMPHLIDIPQDRGLSPLKFEHKGGYYDAGAETLAYIECESEKPPRFHLGESLAEVNEKDPERMEYIPRMVQVGDDLWRTPVPYAFRYLRFGDGQQKMERVKLVPVGRKYEKCGSFKSGSERWNKMFDVGKRTLFLCSQDFLIDGVKRDRLPWAGDLSVSLMATAYVSGDVEIVRRSLSVMDAYTGDVNGIVTYSMWTIIAHDMYQLYFGDRDFLNERWWRVKGRVENLISRCDERGFVTKGLDWVFVDWAKPRSVTALHVIWYGALQAAARLADRVGDTRSAFYRELAEKVRTNVDRLAWDETRGIYRANPNGEPVFGRQANVFAVVLGFADAAKAARIGDALAGDGLPPVGTPYVYGWELVALARTGHHQAFFDGIEKVFGAMLDAGATTFWEGYDASEKGDACYGFYGRPWGKSLCHVWSAWPAFVFVSEAMGVKPTSDGWQTWQRKPITGAERFSAVVPTPKGSLCIGESTH